MSFIAKNPLSIPEIKNTPSTPPGTRGLFAKEDGLYEVDSNKVEKKIVNHEDVVGNFEDTESAYEKLMYYGDTKVEPSDQSLFTFSVNSTTMTAAITGTSDSISGDVVIPYKYIRREKVYTVTSIEIDSFYSEKDLTGVEIPGSVTTIGLAAFDYCSGLTHIKIHNGLTTIKTGAFSNCPNLKSIEIPDSVTTIGSDIFSKSVGLTDVYYQGSEDQWDAISISSSNSQLFNATIHYGHDLSAKNYLATTDYVYRLVENFATDFDGCVGGYFSNHEIDNIKTPGIYKLYDNVLGVAILWAILIVQDNPGSAVNEDGSQMYVQERQTLIDEGGVSTRAWNIDEKKWSSWRYVFTEIDKKADKTEIPKKLSSLTDDITDQTYDETSSKPQSGKAIAEAIKNIEGGGGTDGGIQTITLDKFNSTTTPNKIFFVTSTVDGNTETYIGKIIESRMTGDYPGSRHYILETIGGRHIMMVREVNVDTGEIISDYSNMLYANRAEYAETADSAYNDKYGNDIAETYQKKFATIDIKGGSDSWTIENVTNNNGDVIGSRYGQAVNVNNAAITPNSKVDLQITSEQMVIFYEKSLAFVAENDDGAVTVYCVGSIPENDYTVQAVVTEVVVDV